MNNLNRELREGKIRGLYLLWGEEEYLKQQYALRIRQAVLPGGDTMNLNVYEGKKIAVSELIDQAETFPFFADRRLLVVKESGFFKSANAALASYLEQAPPTSVFLFVESEVDKRQKMYATVNKIGRAVECKRQEMGAIRDWVLGICKKEGKDITRNAFARFLEKTGNDMYNIRMELDKLLSYTAERGQILPEDVESICTTRTEDRIFSLIDALAEGKKHQAFALYRDLLSLNESPTRILFLITRQFNQFLQIKELREFGYDTGAVAKKLGLKPYVAKKCVYRSERFTKGQVCAIVEKCIATEEAIKTGNIDPNIGVETVLASYLP